MKKSTLAILAGGMLSGLFSVIQVNAQYCATYPYTCADWTPSGPKVITAGQSVTFTEAGISLCSDCGAGTWTKGSSFTDYCWTFNGGTPATANGPGPHTIQYNADGSFDVALRITYYYAKGQLLQMCSDYYTLKPGQITVHLPTGEQLTASGKSGFDITSIFPNPAQGAMECVIDAAVAGNNEIAVFDILGRSVLVQPTELLQGENHIRLNLTGLSSGMYYALVRDISGKYVARTPFAVE